MFVHLRVFSMFVLAFVLIVMARSIDDIAINRSGDSFQIKSRGVGSDNVSMLFEIAAKVDVSGPFRKPNVSGAAPLTMRMLLLVGKIRQMN